MHEFVILLSRIQLLDLFFVFQLLLDFFLHYMCTISSLKQSKLIFVFQDCFYFMNPCLFPTLYSLILNNYFSMDVRLMMNLMGRHELKAEVSFSKHTLQGSICLSVPQTVNFLHVCFFLRTIGSISF